MILGAYLYEDELDEGNGKGDPPLRSNLAPETTASSEFYCAGSAPKDILKVPQNSSVSFCSIIWLVADPEIIPIKRCQSFRMWARMLATWGRFGVCPYKLNEDI